MTFSFGRCWLDLINSACRCVSMCKSFLVFTSLLIRSVFIFPQQLLLLNPSLSGLHFSGCSGVSQQACEDERDIMVPGQQLRHSTPPPQRDDLCGPRGLRADAPGEAGTVWSTLVRTLFWISLVQVQVFLIMTVNMLEEAMLSSGAEVVNVSPLCSVSQCGQTTCCHQLQRSYWWTPGERPGQPERGEAQHYRQHDSDRWLK